MKYFLPLIASLLCTFAIVGCGGAPSTTNPAAESQEHAHGDEEHGHEDNADHDAPGPHGGKIVDWGGGKYHLELVLNKEPKELVAYVLDGNAKELLPIAASDLQVSLKEPMVDLILAATPADGEPAGTASRFAAALPAGDEEVHLEGTISGVVDNVPYAGDFHDEHDHDEDDHKAK